MSAAVATAIPPYELWTDAPGILLNKPEWEAANAAHPATCDFGPLPAGWPAEITGPHVWTGEELKSRPESYIRVLTPKEIEEIDNAIQTYKSSARPLSEMTRASFPLPTLGPVLRQLANNIYHGVGVQILRGFPITQYAKADQNMAFLGINTWIGDQRLDQGASRGLCHIKSIAHVDPSQRGKIYVSAQDTNPQLYHSDAGGDIVSLMAVRLPSSSSSSSSSGEHGGASTVGSAAAVYNALAKRRPDILRILAEHKFRWEAKGIPDQGVHLLHWHQNAHLFLNFSTRPFIGYGEVPDRNSSNDDARYPPLTPAEREALGGWQWTMDSLALETVLREGDIEWVNNLVHQHARRGYVEESPPPLPTPGSGRLARRHLLRVWVRDTALSPATTGREGGQGGGLPVDMHNKFEAMFAEAPTFYPLDEMEEDAWRRRTGVFTAVCKDEIAEERLAGGGIGAENDRVRR